MDNNNFSDKPSSYTFSSNDQVKNGEKNGRYKFVLGLVLVIINVLVFGSLVLLVMAFFGGINLASIFQNTSLSAVSELTKEDQIATDTVFQPPPPGDIFWDLTENTKVFNLINDEDESSTIGASQDSIIQLLDESIDVPEDKRINISIEIRAEDDGGVYFSNSGLGLGHYFAIVREDDDWVIKYKSDSIDETFIYGKVQDDVGIFDILMSRSGEGVRIYEHSIADQRFIRFANSFYARDRAIRINTEINNSFFNITRLEYMY